VKLIAITTPKVTNEDASIIKQLLDRGIYTVHLRKPESSVDECRRLLSALSGEYRSRIIIHNYPELY
jgi:thiamine-phosphate pyrophosphorylase